MLRFSILNVAAYVSQSEWFVSLSWSKITDEVTIASVNLSYYSWKRAICFKQEAWIRSVLTNLTMIRIWSRCNKDFRQIHIECRRFESFVNCRSLHQLRRGFLAFPRLKCTGSHIWICESTLLLLKKGHYISHTNYDPLVFSTYLLHFSWKKVLHLKRKTWLRGVLTNFARFWDSHLIDKSQSWLLTDLNWISALKKWC